MAVETPPIFLQAGSHDAEHVRRNSAAQMGLRGGIVAAADLAVTQNGTPNMSVNVAAGMVFIPGTESAFQGVYEAENRSVLNVAIAASDPTNPRKDLIVAKVRDAAYSGASNDFSIVAVTGTPAPSPAEPAVPANAIVLAMVNVAAAAASIVNANITDRRTQQTSPAQQGQAAALGGIIVCTSAQRPAHQAGRSIFETDTGKLLVSDGTFWTAPKNQPQGIVAAATPITANVGPTSGTTPLDIITAPAVTPTASNRRLRVRFHCRGMTGGTTADQYAYKIQEGATVLQESVQVFNTASITNNGVDFEAIIDSPSVAAHTYKATITRTSGTGTVSVSASATGPITLTVEDAGGI